MSRFNHGNEKATISIFIAESMCVVYNSFALLRIMGICIAQVFAYPRAEKTKSHGLPDAEHFLLCSVLFRRCAHAKSD